MKPFSREEIQALIDQKITDPCPKCGAHTKMIKRFDIDIVCLKSCGWSFPVDTGPFSLGRRVD